LLNTRAQGEVFNHGAAMTTCNHEEYSILLHTQKNKRFCGDSKEMQSLIEKGLMKSLGKVSWVPDEYFGLTDAGKQFLTAFQDPGKLPIAMS
jgi:hypothetical protein